MSLWRDKILPALAPRAAYAYIRLARATMRVEYENHDALERARKESGQFILAFWHSRYVMMPYVYLPNARIVVLISRHRDARMLGRILERFGLAVAHGSSTAGGVQGLREVIRRVKGGYDVGIAPDGPRGPRRRIRPGVISVARLTGLPIVPVAFSARPARRLGSWDRTLVPLPFSRGLFICGEPMPVARGADDAEEERLRLRLEAEVDRITDLADTRTGIGVEEVRPPVEP
jgi:lysophospholipid acyltransferase (LPLAT)-like uncharacterized protein